MSKLIPPPIHDVAAEFDGLPGVGPRAALRYAYWMMTLPRDRILRFANALQRLADGVTRCKVCGLWSVTSPCIICANPSRDRSKICVVAGPQDVRIIEESGAFKGLYHVTSGTIDPVSGRTPDQLFIPQLIRRLQDPASVISEIVLAFDADVPGDTTYLYIKKQIDAIGNAKLRITRLARGLPTGSQLEYADEMTIAEALENRR
ncbi:MAG: recombination mediator RecR [Candidatus Uhrbacteria bacterium]|nr:recombination mediator RecR [Candidatus Uhrbacteria bacterium]